MTRRLGLLLVSVLLVSVPSTAESFLVIVSGLGGDDRYRDAFHEWAVTMKEAAVSRHGVSPDRVYYLAEKPETAPELIRAKSTKENVSALFEEIAGAVAPGDQLFVLLIGHGSFRDEQSRFNLPGPDMTAEDFDALLDRFPEQQIVFVNASSASGGFLPVLADSNRVVVTATKSGFERNESQFGRYFVEAYAEDGADTDKNERVSLLEAYRYAKLSVDRFYDEENILKTEHAQFDDDGDGAGIHDPGEDEGRKAAGIYLATASAVADGFSEADLATDPELAELVEKKLDLEGRVESLTLQKDSMPEELYLSELETLLLELAQVSAELEARREP